MGMLARRAAEAMVGTTDFHRESGRRAITSEDVCWAEDRRRAGWGWQAIAAALKVNQTDLRTMCGDLADPKKAQAAAVAGATAGPKLVIPPGVPPWQDPRGVSKWRRASVPAQVRLLAALVTTGRVQLAAQVIGLDEPSAWSHASKLRADGFIGSEGYGPTPKGWARLEAAGLAVR